MPATAAAVGATGKFLCRRSRSPTPAPAASTKANALGMRPMQERAYEKRGEQYLLIKSPPASGKSRALMFIALDKLQNQGLKQAIIVVPEKAIGASFHDEPLTQVWLLGGLDRRAEMEPLQRAGRGQRRQGQCGRRVPRKRRQGAGLHPCDLPLRRRQVRGRGVRRSADRGGRVSPRLGQSRQQARRSISGSSSPATRCISSR